MCVCVFKCSNTSVNPSGNLNEIGLNERGWLGRGISSSLLKTHSSLHSLSLYMGSNHNITLYRVIHFSRRHARDSEISLACRLSFRCVWNIQFAVLYLHNCVCVCVCVCRQVFVCVRRALAYLCVVLLTSTIILHLQSTSSLVLVGWLVCVSLVYYKYIIYDEYITNTI